MHNYTLFEQHQSGIYTREGCVDHTVGTKGVGPCIAFFLYNTETKSCLAMHIDACMGMNVIKTAIREFLPDYAGIEQCHAFLVGGWKSAITEGDTKVIDLPKFLRDLKVGQLQTQLLKLDGKLGAEDPRNVYHTVLLNLDNGKLNILQSPNHDFVPHKDQTTEENKLYMDCMDYMLHGVAFTLSSSIDRMLRGRSFTSLRPEVQAYYLPLINSTDGTPVIPVRDLLPLASAQTTAMALAASRGNALEVLKLLCDNFVNPVYPVPGKLGNTPLHYACDALNKKPGDFNLKAIVLMLLLHGKRDLKNDAGNLALSKINNIALKEFKELSSKLVKFLQTSKDGSSVSSKIAVTYKIIMAMTMDDVLEYPNASQEAKLEIEARLIDSVGMIMLATAPKAEIERRKAALTLKG